MGALFGKFGAVFTTIPDPVVAGMFFVMFGMITAVGLSSLKYVDLDSSRNLLIIGLSLFLGLAIPGWIKIQQANGVDFNLTGNSIFDDILLIFMKTNMFISMTVAFFLDNTAPGTKKERGLLEWNKVEAKHLTVEIYSVGLLDLDPSGDGQTEEE